VSIAVLTLAAAGLVACTGGGGDTAVTAATSPDAAPSAATPSTTASGAPAPAPEATGVPAAARRQLDWFLGVLAGDELAREAYEQRFTEQTRRQLPYEQLVGVVDQLRATGPYTVQQVGTGATTDLVAEVTASDGTPLRILIDLGADDRMQTLLVQPAEPPTLDDPPTSPAAAADRLAELGTVGMAAAVVDGTSCDATVDRAADRQMPIGSAFKLYVLGAVADAVAAGEATWDEQLEITGDVRSIPSGVLQDREPGSLVTVREAAELMIRISDNTAADLLIRRLGRDAVEEAQAAYGHSAPDRNAPFLTTRELAALKFADDATQRAWITGDAAQRRDLLTDLSVTDVAELPVRQWTQPRHPDTIEWFASPLDLCRALATLWERAQQPALEPLATILTANPGVPADDRWEEVAFKGGSEPGLVATAWLMVDEDGRRFALTGAVVDPDEPFDQTRAVLLLAAARDTVGQP
jgi:hypothetical protein